MAPDIRVRDLKVWYGTQPALKGITLDVAGGSVLAVIGPSGCGKSTFLRVLNRLVDRAPGVRLAGSVRIGDLDVLDPRVDLVELRRRVGMVFQQPNPFPFSIYDNVVYGPRLHGITHPGTLRAIAEDSLRQASLWDEVRGKLRRPASTLSGGQQQRLCLARALAVRPDVLLMDEPTSALDPVSTARIEELITTLKGRYTIVLVTHNLQQAARVSDHTAFFAAGELVEIGPTPLMFTAPRDRRTEDYLTGRDLS
ncbi:MAG: phosphate ABC transporter ATP-binding protein PstB [Actinomycetia bacterium]|nr:phosphate ABC transporter ATP-binding protein PstB [Actinomycetes bacterium]